MRATKLASIHFVHHVLIPFYCSSNDTIRLKHYCFVNQKKDKHIRHKTDLDMKGLLDWKHQQWGYLMPTQMFWLSTAQSGYRYTNQGLYCPQFFQVHPVSYLYPPVVD